MTVSALRTMISLVIATVLAAGVVIAGSVPATAAGCTSTTTYVELYGHRVNSPTDGCVGPTDWVLLVCTSREISNPDDSIVIGSGACVAIPPN